MIPESFPREYGGYRLTAFLGSGGTADVYRAELPPTPGQPPREVAIRRVARQIGQDQQVLAVLFDESRIWVTLRHPNIVTVIDIGQHEGDCFLVLELVEGLAANQLLLADDRLPLQEGLLIAADIADALHYGHEHTIAGRRVTVVHRDVKPANILVSVDGEVKLTDFGIARTNDRLGRTQAGVVRGSIHYLSPEQVKKEPLTARTDLFLLGCTLHTLLTGKPLLDLPKEAVLRLLDRGDVPPPDESLAPAARKLISLLTKADPAERPESAAAVSSTLRALVRNPDEARRSLADRVRKVYKQVLDRDQPTAALGSTMGETRGTPVGALAGASTTTTTASKTPRE